MVYKLLLFYIIQDPASIERKKEVIVPQDFKTQQDDHYLMPGTYATNGNRSPQFRVPGASFPKVPETTIYNTPAISIHDVHNDDTKEINDYIQEATKVVKVGEKEVATFAPFRPKLSALQTFTRRQVVTLCVIGLLWMIGVLVFRLEMLTIVIGVITVMYTFNLILNLGMAARTFRNSPEEHIDDAIVHALKNANWPMYTILCPLYREAQVVPQFV